jgi:hypothetical protein
MVKFIKTPVISFMSNPNVFSESVLLHPIGNQTSRKVKTKKSQGQRFRYKSPRQKSTDAHKLVLNRMAVIQTANLFSLITSVHAFLRLLSLSIQTSSMDWFVASYGDIIPHSGEET